MSHNYFITNKNNGFSIVELTIVLVVIGILASIIAVAYTSTQNGARTARYYTDASSIAKYAEIAAGDNDGQFPIAAADFTGTASLNSDTNISIGSVMPSGSSEPTSTSGISTPPAYTIKVCSSTREGLRVYYPDPDTSTTAIKYIDSGKWSSTC